MITRTDPVIFTKIATNCQYSMKYFFFTKSKYLSAEAESTDNETLWLKDAFWGVLQL